MEGGDFIQRRLQFHYCEAGEAHEGFARYRRAKHFSTDQKKLCAQAAFRLSDRAMNGRLRQPRRLCGARKAFGALHRD